MKNTNKTLFVAGITLGLCAQMQGAVTVNTATSGTINGTPGTRSGGAALNPIAGFGGATGQNRNRGVLYFDLSATTVAAELALNPTATFQLTYDVTDVAGDGTVALDYIFVGTLADGTFNANNDAVAVNTLQTGGFTSLGVVDTPALGTGFTTDEITIDVADLAEDFAVFVINPGTSPGETAQVVHDPATFTLTVTSVPEPSIALLSALAGLGFFARRRR